MLLQLPEVGLHWEQAGEGEPVIFINGIMMTARSWQPQTQTLSRRWRCIHYDLRGQLLSGKPPGPYGFEQHASDLLSLLDSLELPSAHLVGISYGGAVAQRFAARHPRRVRSLSLITTTAEATAAHRQRFQAWLDVLEAQPRELFAFTLRENYSTEFIRGHRAELEHVDAWYRGRGDDYYQGLRSLVPSIRDVNLRPALASIECPVLVVAARHDALVGREASYRLAAAIPGARLKEIAGGHAISIEQPAALNAVLAEFLQRQEATVYGEDQQV